MHDDKAGKARRGASVCVPSCYWASHLRLASELDLNANEEGTCAAFLMLYRDQHRSSLLQLPHFLSILLVISGFARDRHTLSTS